VSTRRARVVVAYATVKLLDPISGKPAVAGFYQGAIFPPEADPDNVASLVRREYAEWLDEDEAELVKGQETDADKAQQAAAQQRLDVADAAARQAEGEPEPVTDDGQGDEDDDQTSEPLTRRPRVNAAKEAWVDYAVSQRDEGVSEEDARAEAEAKSKAELVAEYGG
jgi:hypothetical protein